MKVNLDFVQPSLRPESEIMYLGENIVNRELQMRHYEDVTVVPYQGVFRSDGAFIDESFLHPNHRLPKSFRAPDGYDQTIPEAVYIGMFINIWGHCLTDCMKHLWPVLVGDGRFKTLPLVWVKSRERMNVFDNFWKMLELLGVDMGHVRQITTPAKVEKLWIPDPCFFTDERNYQRLCTPEYGRLFDKIISAVPQISDAPEKIYFTRTALKVHNRDYGEKSIERIFSKKGYRIYSPETLTLERTIGLLKGASFFACTDGSIAHNALFMSKGSQLVIIRKADTVNSYQSPINQVKDLNVTFIDSHWSKFLYNNRAPWDGPFFIYPSARLKRWAGVRIANFPLKDLARYLYDALGARIKARLGL